MGYDGISGIQGKGGEMKWYRKITQCLFQKEEADWNPKPLRVFTVCGWGTLTEFDHTGKGFISFDVGGGQLVRDWNHFFNLVQLTETE